jgi:FAD/FMN-containing dehydrogenase
LAVSTAQDCRLLVGLEGTALEVEWMGAQLGREWSALGVSALQTHRDAAADRIGSRLTEGSATRAAPMVAKFNVRPSSVTRLMKTVLGIDSKASLQAHAGNGIVVAAMAEFSPPDASRILIQRLQPAAVAAGGNVVVWSCPSGDLTRQAIWGAGRGDADVMRAVKRQFDPKGLLNPDRFVYGSM